jgi:hypothetical protein
MDAIGGADSKNSDNPATFLYHSPMTKQNGTGNGRTKIQH